MTRCYVALGGNVGDVAAAMESGLQHVDRVPGVRVTRVSPIYRTAPVGPETATFLNAAAELACDVSPSDLLRELQAVERQCGRKRAAQWGPRALDLDILLFGDAVVAEPRLTIPHPHLWYRRFVLDPLCDLAPAAVHPVFAKTVGRLRDDLLRRPLPVMLTGGDRQQRTALGEYLQDSFPAIMMGGEQDARPDNLIVLDLAPTADTSATEPHTARPDETIGSARERRIRLQSLPGSLPEAAASVLTAAFDYPAPYTGVRPVCW